MNIVDEATGEILADERRAMIVMPDASELQRYQTDEALIALSEQILEFGLQELASRPEFATVRDRRAQGSAAIEYILKTAHDRRMKQRAKNNITHLILLLMHDIGEVLKTRPKKFGARGTGGNQYEVNSSNLSSPPTNGELGFTDNDSSLCQKVNKIPINDLLDVIAAFKENDWELSVYGVLSFYAKNVMNESYDGDEWYTPSEYIEAARELMGGIDCDPASCEQAQRVVKAATYYTIDDDGLKQDWIGRVWLNPPYSQPKIEQFTERLIEQFEAGNTTEAVLLVNNCTDAGWFLALAQRYPMMFSEGRARFWQADQKTFATRQGQAIFYMGDRPGHFFTAFSDLAYAPNMLLEEN